MRLLALANSRDRLRALLFDRNTKNDAGRILHAGRRRDNRFVGSAKPIGEDEE
jgi:hypothetical protein